MPARKNTGIFAPMIGKAKAEALIQWMIYATHTAAADPLKNKHWF